MQPWPRGRALSNDITPDAWKTKLGNSPAKTVLVKISEVANESGFGWPSLAHICDRTELSNRQVQRVLQVFEEIGLIARTKTTLQSGKVVPAMQIALELLGKDLRVEFRAAFLRAQSKLPVEEGVSETVGQPVSETSESVSETQKGVSETHPPHPLYGGTAIEPSGNQPPYPPRGESEFSLHPLLLHHAADEVMRACGWTVEGDRRLRNAVLAQLRLASMQGEALPLASARMICAWAEHLDASAEGLLRGSPYGPKKFIGLGKWNDRDSWHWDTQKLDRRRDARVGMWQGAR